MVVYTPTANRNWQEYHFKNYFEAVRTLTCPSDPLSMHKTLSVKSRVRGDFHARFCERMRVKLPRSTRPLTLAEAEILAKTFSRTTAFSGATVTNWDAINDQNWENN